MRATAIALALLVLITACGPEAGVAPGAALPRNEGGNASLHGVHVRNAFLLRSGSLHAVLINSGPAADRLEQVSAAAVTVTLSAPLDLRPNEPMGIGGPIAAVTGIGAGTPGWLPVTFRFREAGSVTVQIPVKERP